MTFSSYVAKRVGKTFPIRMKGSRSEIPMGSRLRMRKRWLDTSISMFRRTTILG